MIGIETAKLIKQLETSRIFSTFFPQKIARNPRCELKARSADY
jgi:hypothetical protein